MKNLHDQTSEVILRAKEPVDRCINEIKKRIIGQNELIEGLFIGILAGGHILVEGVPGLAKTMAIKTLADVLDVRFKRIQFTPDLLPADLIGTMTFRPQTGEFVPRKGPVFSNIVLADEINRAPAKVQSALLEAMQENQVTIGNETFRLATPFLVMATQNPIEQEGTYPLPEAQLDRFLIKVLISYPQVSEEVQIVKLVGNEKNIPIEKVFDKGMIESTRKIVDGISVDDRIVEYIVRIVNASREKQNNHAEYSKFIEFGASPRASIYIFRCARIKAFMEGRDFVIPDDVKEVALLVMRHRIILNYEAEAENLTTDDIVNEILNFVQVP